METLKFLMMNSTYPPYGVGGDANYVQGLSYELVKRGHEVHVVHSIDAYNLLSKVYGLSTGKIDAKGHFDRNLFIHSLTSPLRMLDPVFTYSIGKSKYYYKCYIKILKEVRPDVVHHHDITFLGYNFLKKAGNYSLIHTAHNYWLICPNRELMRFDQVCNKPNLCSFCLLHSKRLPQLWRLRKDFKDSINDIDTIIAPSNFMKDKLAKELDVRIEHIPNFVSCPPQKIKDSGYSNYFLYAGVLEKRKGILDLLDVFKNHSNEIDAKLIIVGSGSLQNQIREFIIKHNLQNRVVFLGFVDREMLWSLYKDALAVVMPSIWAENNPLVALEAISVGTPVIGSDQGGIPEIIEKVDNRLIFRAGDLEGMKRVLVEYDRAKYSAERVKKVHEKWYSVGGYISRYFDLLDRI